MFATRRFSIRLVAVLALLAACAAARPALAGPGDPVTGIWQLTLVKSEPRSEKDRHEGFVMRLRLDGNRVTGTVQLGKETATVFDGTWRDGRLVLVLGTSKDKTWYLTLRGTLQPDGTIVGTAEEYENGSRLSGTFEAHR
jgi:hypothetical protein